MLSIKDSLQQQIHFNGNTFGNKCCRCYAAEGSLYLLQTFSLLRDFKGRKGKVLV